MLNLEVQLASLMHMADRMIFNTSRILSLNTFSGTKFEELPKVTVISILNFLFRKGHLDFHQPFGVFYEKDPERVTDKIDYHTLETPKFLSIEPNFSIALHRWMFYLVRGCLEPDNPKVKEVLQMDEGLYLFAKQYQHNINDPKTLYKYYGYVMERMDEQDRIDTARFEGRAEGEQHANKKWQSVLANKDAEIAELRARINKTE